MKRYIIIVILSFTILFFMLSNVASSSSGYFIPYIKTVNPINFQTPSYNQYTVVSNSGSYSDIILLENQNNSNNLFKVAFCQQPASSASTISCKIADMEWALTNMANEAIVNSSDMIIFSETAFCTYDCAPRPVLAEEIPSIDPDESPVYCRMAQYAKENNVWIYYGDYVKSDDPNKPYNSGIMIKPDGELGFIYNKHYGSKTEINCGSYGDSPYTFDIDHPLGKIGCLICKDFHAGGSIDIKNLDFNFMLGIAGDVDGRSKNHYGLWMEDIITSDPVKSNGGVWVNFAKCGGSFFMDECGNILENVDGGGNVIKYHEFSINSDTWICGDTNNDSKINSTDILLLTKYTFYPEGIQINELAGDVDGSGCNNILDSRLLMKHVFNETQYPLICK